jgi:hypothetical protein
MVQGGLSPDLGGQSVTTIRLVSKKTVSTAVVVVDVFTPE